MAPGSEGRGRKGRGREGGREGAERFVSMWREAANIAFVVFRPLHTKRKTKLTQLCYGLHYDSCIAKVRTKFIRVVVQRQVS